MMKKFVALLIALMLLQTCLCWSAMGEAALQPELQTSEARLALESYLDADPELNAMMEKSIALAREINPDPKTNPIGSVEELLDYIDGLTTCMPWNVLTDAAYPTLYDSIDQSVDYNLLCPENESGTGYRHILMGEPYSSLTAE